MGLDVGRAATGLAYLQDLSGGAMVEALYVTYMICTYDLSACVYTATIDINTYVYNSIDLSTYIYIYIFIFIFIFMYIHMCASTYIYIYTYVYVYMHL